MTSEQVQLLISDLMLIHAGNISRCLIVLDCRVKKAPPTTGISEPNAIVYLTMPTTFTTLKENLHEIKRLATIEETPSVIIYLSTILRDMDRFENDFLRPPPSGIGVDFVIAFTRLKTTIEAFLDGV